MNCFQIIKRVLDQAYAEIPARSDEEKDDLIKRALADLEASYKRILSSGCIDYSDLIRRFAYIFRYTTMHANLVYQICNGSRTLKGLLKRDSISISAIGGGPGSDFLGIIKICEEMGIHPSINVKVFDRDPAWSESWENLDSHIGDTIRVRNAFINFDITDPNSWRKFKRLYQADLVTLIYFFSEVYRKREEATTYFRDLFNNLNRGSLVLFADNDDSRVYNWFDSLSREAGLRRIIRESRLLKMTPDEQAADLAPYFGKYGFPRLKAKVAFRLVQKPAA